MQSSKTRAKGYPQELIILGDHLRAKRINLDLPQRDVAQLLKAHVHSVINWERNRNEPSLKRVPRIIDALNEKDNGDTSMLPLERQSNLSPSRGYSKTDPLWAGLLRSRTVGQAGRASQERWTVLSTNTMCPCVFMESE